MILGTSKILTFVGPIIGHFWAHRPRICGLYYTELLQKILRGIWEHHGKYYIWKSENQKIRKFRNMCVPNFLNFWNFEILKFWNLKYIKLTNYILWRWGSGNDSFSINKIHKSLDINFISIKNMKWIFWFFGTYPHSHIAT